jgi:predicted phage terminase large subunit-like protein
VWAGQDLATCQQQIGDWGLRAFLIESQHEVQRLREGLFRREWFRLVEDFPRDLDLVRFWDLAASEKTTADWTAGVLVGEKDGRYWILDVIRRKASPLEVERLLRHTAERDGCGVKIVIEQEGGAAGVHLIDHYVRRVLKGFRVVGRRPFGDKVAKAQVAAAACQAGNVLLLRAPWNDAFLEELERFPDPAVNDDVVDACAGSVNELAGVTSAAIPVRRRGRLLRVEYG